MNANPPAASKLTIPNLLTGFRFVAAPGLLWLAWYGYSLGFMGLLAIVFFSDFLDGMVARITGQVSEFGAVLDSCADVVTYMTVTVCCWWLWPDVVSREFIYVGMIVASFLLSAAVGWIKFGRFTSYHTWAVKLAAAAMGISLFILFWGGPAWPFRIAAILCLYAGLEEIIISLLLPKPESNVRSLLSVIKTVRQHR